MNPQTPDYEQTSVVLPLGMGSHSGNLELKFALRSIEKHLKGVKNIFIVGEKPRFLNTEEVIYIPQKDTARKQLSIKRKIEAAIHHPRCTETFAFWNDDFVLLRDTDLAHLPVYYSGDLASVSEKGARHLLPDLKKRGLPTRHADIHCPILYNKEMFTAAMQAFDWQDRDFVIKSLYSNYHRLEGIEMKDLKINTSLSYERIKAEIKDRWIFSYGDYGLNPPMKRLLEELFPEPSKYELINQQNKAA
jgi:hypothetical protein